MRGGGVPAEHGSFAFPNARVELAPRVLSALERRRRRVRELVAELRLYHHDEAADEMERMLLEMVKVEGPPG